MTSPRPNGSYGTDAPWVPWMWIGFGVVYAVLAVLSATTWGAPTWVTVIVAIVAVGFVAGGALYWHTSARGKFTVWRALLEQLSPAHRVLDMGCGRGAVAIMTAQRFPEAVVDGVDLWRSVDQSGNTPQAAEANARANGVADRVRFATGDMTALPYPDASFDLVTASLSIHNIHSPQGRATAIDEAWRVLKPGGRLLVLDISKTGEYRRRLEQLDADDLVVRDAGWRVWWSGPWMASGVVSATKPGT